MTLRKLLTQRLPEPPAEAPGLADMLAHFWNMPELARVRRFWEALDDMRAWWPIILPLLILVGWRTYRRERRRLRARRISALS
jgi:hypothetical protein